MRRKPLLCIVAALALGMTSGAGAALLPPPPGETSFGPISLADGFPIWYQDQNGLKLQFCLDQDTVEPVSGNTLLPCLTAEPVPGLPISFPFNFGAEAFWWAADASTTFVTTPLPTAPTGFIGAAVLVTALEATFANGFPIDGQQVAFARVRLRIDVPVPGEYRVTHPYGRATYTFTAADLVGRRAINETQDVGFGAVGDFFAALNDGPAAPELPGEPQPRVDDTLPDRSIGPFLTPAGDPATRVLLNGNVYLTVPQRINPATGLVEALTVPVAGGIGGQDYFEVELVPTADTPTGFFLDAANASNVIRVEQFTLAGKVFNAGANLPPVAHPERIGLAPGALTSLLVLGNDVDVRALDPADPLNPANPANTNVHGLNVQALAIPAGPNLVKNFTTANGGAVSRVVNLAQGRALFSYTPAAGFAGTDSFRYVTQDTGGLLSNATTVTLAVEDLQVAATEFRTKLLKWRVEGTSSDANPRAALSGAQEVPAVVTPGTGTATFTLSADGTSLAYALDVAGLSGAPQAAHLHLGEAGVEAGILFDLSALPFGDAATGSGSLTGTLTAAQFVAQGDVGTFAQAVAALFAGRTYVNVHTAVNPGGEVRGQVLPNTITVHLGATVPGSTALGTAPVQPDGSWSLQRHGLVPPGGETAVSVESANGVRVLNRTISIR